MYDVIRVYFMDGTGTTIYVPEDEYVAPHLADLEDEEGVDVADWEIIGQTD